MLYNPRLDVFINVANAGSFTKAAKEEYITPGGCDEADQSAGKGTRRAAL